MTELALILKLLIRQTVGPQTSCGTIFSVKEKKKRRFTVTTEVFLSGCCRFLFLNFPSDLVHEAANVAKPDQ